MIKTNTLLSIVLFFCTGVLFAQNITLQINNNTTTNYTGTSIRNALTTNSITPGSITHLTITAGNVTSSDWYYLRDYRASFSAMTHFTVTNGVTMVANMPDTTESFPYFMGGATGTIEEVSVAKLRNIGKNAFYECKSLTTASFPQATSIGQQAFAFCSSLTTTSFQQVTSISRNAFAYCSNLTTVSFPQATSIGQYAFYNCTSLTTLTLNANPPTAYSGTFSGTSTTCSVMVPNATAITAYINVNDGNQSDNLWYGCKLGVIGITITDNTNATKTIVGSSLQDALTSETPANIVSMEINSGEVTTADWNYLKGKFPAMTHFTVTNGVTSVADIPNTRYTDPYFTKNKIEEVSVAKLQKIGEYAFRGCSKLTTANFPQATSLGKGAFRECSNLTTASFPQVTSIGNQAFLLCQKLTTASFPQATSIGQQAFGLCQKLTTVSFPKATTIYHGAFDKCTSLTTVSFPEATSMGRFAFVFCSNLATVSFPKAMSIGQQAFQDCSNLTTLTLKATPPTSVGTDAFKNTPTTRNLIIADNTGTPLTGTALTNAISNYDADEGVNNDNLWYGWKLNGTIWTGAANQDWNTASNWYINAVPTATDNVFIPKNKLPKINSGVNATVNNLTIEGDANVNNAGYLSVLNNGSLTINGNVDLKTNAGINVSSTMPSAGTINSGSVVLKGTYTEATPNSFTYFTETYHNNDDGWTLVSSPTVGEVIDGGATGFATFNKLQKNATNYGIAKYDNSVATNRWDYYTPTEVAATNNTVMTSGKGYSIFPDSDASGATGNQKNGTVGFKGSIPTTDVAVAIVDNSAGNGTGVGDAFNLVGNPYPSYIPANTNAGNTNNILTINSGVLEEQTIWLWNKASASYVTVNQLTSVGTDMSANQRPSLYIAPAQGFFVKSNSTGGNFNFTEAMQEHQTSGVFNRPSASDITQLTLKISDGKNNEKATNIYYVAGKTVNFDNGYDSSMFGGTTPNFDVFTALVGNSQGEKLAIQALPNNDFDTLVVPVGLIAKAGKEITFSNVAKNVPSDIKVYLEDRATGTFTNLVTDTYKVTLDQAQNSTGRFFVHTKSSALSTDTVSLAGVSIYKSNATTLTITGVHEANARVEVFNLLGKQMLAEKLTVSSVNNISLPSLATGVYIVKVASETGSITKKVIIE